jgi:hypothetical protein
MPSIRQESAGCQRIRQKEEKKIQFWEETNQFDANEAIGVKRRSWL